MKHMQKISINPMIKILISNIIFDNRGAEASVETNHFSSPLNSIHKHTKTIECGNLHSYSNQE